MTATMAEQAEHESRGMRTGQLIVYVADRTIDDETIASVKRAQHGATIFADLLEPLYDASISTRDAAHALGRIKLELESMVEKGERIVLLCGHTHQDLGTRAHFLTSLCASADRVHFLKST
jgi:hypothetical protein